MGRAQRTVNNHIEGMLLFVPLAIVAELSNIDSNLALKGAGLYIIARVIYPLTYWTGLPVVRSLVWFASLGGTIMLFIAIVTA